MAMTARQRAPGLFREIGLPRVFAVAAVIVVALALQSTLLAQVTILGVIPQVVLVVVVCFAYLDGERVGLVTGFSAGMLQDLLPFPAVIGLTAFVYTLVGYGVGILRQYAPADAVWTPVLVVALSSAVAELGYAALAIILGEPWVGLGYTARVAGLVVLYNTLLTPFVFPLVRRVADRFRPEKVHRW
ncbi:MAG: rod shape-determining protein MreD [Actinomycetota bacterium]